MCSSPWDMVAIGWGNPVVPGIHIWLLTTLLALPKSHSCGQKSHSQGPPSYQGHCTHDGHQLWDSVDLFAHWHPDEQTGPESKGLALAAHQVEVRKVPESKV